MLNKSPLRIAMVAPIIESVPPKKYGGTERVVDSLTEELVKRGHDVTLFASGDSITNAKLVSVFPRGLREAKMNNIYGGNNWTLLNIATAYNRQDQFDIIHDHIGELSIPTANLAHTPVVITIHGAFNLDNKQLFESAISPHFVTISNSQASSIPYLNYAGTVYNGLDMEEYPFSESHEGYLLYVGRISPEKGVHRAIEVAQYLNLPLIIAAKLNQDVPVDLQYFRDTIEPKLSDQIRWIGEVDETQRNQLMSKAICFLHPVNWKEPFGLTLIESMACGTPVVAFNLGSIPEIIVNGKTGFVVSDIEQMVAAVYNVGKLDRRACREYALKNFSAKKMADGYEELYYKIAPSAKINDIAKSFVSSKASEILGKDGEKRPIFEMSYAHDIAPLKRKRS
jgi:glycosyltransferase involved in cell wall biosynthesis